jgi:hypothetical protein
MIGVRDEIIRVTNLEFARPEKQARANGRRVDRQPDTIDLLELLPDVRRADHIETLAAVTPSRRATV